MKEPTLILKKKGTLGTSTDGKAHFNPCSHCQLE